MELILAIAVVGGVAYGAVVLSRRRRRPKPLQRIDVFTLSEPWRLYMQKALKARRRFADVVGSARSGPVQDRLIEIGGRIDTAVEECWRIAQRGHALDDGVATLDLPGVRGRIDRLEGTRPDSPDDADSWDKRVEALHAQLASGERLRSVAVDARRRLDLLNARLDEAVARAVELSLSAGDVSQLSGLGADVDEVVVEMEALRQGLEEAGRASGGTST